MSTTNAGASPPAHTIRKHSLKTSIWRNETRNGSMYNVRSFAGWPCNWRSNSAWSPRRRRHRNELRPHRKLPHAPRERKKSRASCNLPGHRERAA